MMRKDLSQESLNIEETSADYIKCFANARTVFDRLQ